MYNELSIDNTSITNVFLIYCILYFSSEVIIPCVRSADFQPLSKTRLKNVMINDVNEFC